MIDEELNKIIIKADDELDQMKDRVHDLYNENQRLKYRLNNHPMNNVYIKKEDVNKWIGKHFPNQDLISIDDLIGCIEDLDGELEHLKEEFEDYKENVSENYKPIY